MAKDTKELARKWRGDFALMHQFAKQGLECAEGLQEELGTVMDICEAILRDLEDLKI